ncbi:MAG: hypothetical protein ACK5QC_06075 [Bacteroidota bacterium]
MLISKLALQMPVMEDVLRSIACTSTKQRSGALPYCYKKYYLHPNR